MRKLQTQDVFRAIRVIKATDLKEDLKDIVEKANAGESDGKTDGNHPTIRDIGLDVIFKVLEKTAEANAENAIYEFLSGPLEVTAGEVKEMELLALVEQITQCADTESWKVFFGRVSALAMK